MLTAGKSVNIYPYKFNTIREIQMFHSKNHKQHCILDPWQHLGPRGLLLLENSWAGLFRKEILPELPVEVLRKYCHDIYVNLKRLWTMGQLLSQEGMQQVRFDRVCQKLVDIFKMDFQYQRFDSFHVQSNRRRLGRIRLFVKTIRRLLITLKRHQRSLLLPLETELVTRCLEKKQEAVSGVVKPSVSHAALSRLAQDLYTLINTFNTSSSMTSTSSFTLRVRLFNEQCLTQEENGEKIAAAKNNKDVVSDSLQNPSDPDAGYSGKGYHVHVRETYAPESSFQPLVLITHIRVESADKSDTDALLPAIDQSAARNMAPRRLLANSLYGSDNNGEAVRVTHEVELIAPVIGKTVKGVTIRRPAMYRKKRNRRIVPRPLYAILLAFLDINTHLMQKYSSSLIYQDTICPIRHVNLKMAA